MVWCRFSCIVNRALVSPAGQGAPGVLSYRNPAGALAVLDDVALVLHLCTLGQKTLAALGATAGEDGAAVLGCHAGAETELALAAALGRLVCSLAHNFLFGFEVVSVRPHETAGCDMIPENQRMSSTVRNFFRYRSEFYMSESMNLSSASHVTSPFTRQRPVAMPMAPRILTSSVSMIRTSPGTTGRRHFTLSQLMK